MNSPHKLRAMRIHNDKNDERYWILTNRGVDKWTQHAERALKHRGSARENPKTLQKPNRRAADGSQIALNSLPPILGWNPSP